MNQFDPEPVGPGGPNEPTEPTVPDPGVPGEEGPPPPIPTEPTDPSAYDPGAEPATDLTGSASQQLTDPAYDPGAEPTTDATEGTESATGESRSADDEPLYGERG